MDTHRWQQRDEFTVLDLVAEFNFKTASSLSFQLGTKGDTLDMPGMEKPWVLGDRRVFTVIGWLDAHYSKETFHHLFLRVGLPDRYACWESMRDLVSQVKAAIGLPADESYQISMNGLALQTSMEDPQSGFVSYSGGTNDA